MPSIVYFYDSYDKRIIKHQYYWEGKWTIRDVDYSEYEEQHGNKPEFLAQYLEGNEADTLGIYFINPSDGKYTTDYFSLGWWFADVLEEEGQ
ncbi:MAG: hypothetical protein R2883_03370 [Caldisericia bacterium]